MNNMNNDTLIKTLRESDVLAQAIDRKEIDVLLAGHRVKQAAVLQTLLTAMKLAAMEQYQHLRN
jgi:hypothetical protein